MEFGIIRTILLGILLLLAAIFVSLVFSGGLAYLISLVLGGVGFILGLYACLAPADRRQEEE